jgi:catechol 2,3-dioxygenase-like lactoylglutathione lyase family enzyme
MLDHISLRVQDYDKALAFYKAALAPIGYSVIMEFPGFAGLGEKGKPDFWITRTDKPCNPTHVAFRTERAHIAAFHAAAIAAGGTENGEPGPRSQYHPHYFGAFVLDPEGNNVEAVCHEAPGGAAQFAADKLTAAGERIKAAGRKLKAAVTRKTDGAKAKVSAATKKPVAKAKAQAAGVRAKVTAATKKPVARAKAAAGKAKAAAGKARAKVTKKR